nr:PREDICTED: putative wall-associated receptor kinase-like 16 [Musa acuminata subsp. malaccensis]
MGLVEILLFLLASTSMGSIRTESRSTNTTFRLPFSCRKSCGSISFGYPFGIDDGCFRTGFNLTCRNHSTSSPRLFLGDGTIELTRLNQKELHLVNTSGIKVIMFDGDDDVLQGVLKGRRTNAEATLAWYMNDHLSCEEAKNTDTYACVIKAIPMYLVAVKGCYRGKSFALTCNETSGPPVLLFNSHYKVSTILLEEGKLELERVNEYDYTFESERTRLFACFEEQTIVSWVIASQFCEDARKNMTTFACVDAHSSCFDTTTTNNIQDVSGYYCKCSQGYQGNPYLRHGCKDINECNSTEKPLCYGICTNTDGGYTCTCAAGTYGDPKLAPCIPNNKKQTLLLGVIIGASNGIGLLLLCSSLLILRRKWKKRKQKKTREKYFHQNHGLLLQQLISSTEDISEKTKIFSLEEMEKATNNFDETRVLGRGGHGTVYKGILSDQRVVAVKKSKYMKQSEIDQFINEVAVLSQINHRNIVKLFGCCLETEVPLLIYEFISNGTLLDHLHIPNGNSILSWDDRLRIAVEAAGALAYLHSAASISIFHRDVKSSNVLLDDHLTVKISDFGSSRLIPLDQTHLLTGVQGTFGYLDPEYYHTSQLTEKSDVYSFGVILLELLTGKKPIFSTECEDRLNLSMHFLQTVRENHRFDLIDDLVMKEATEEELIDMIGLVEMCLRLKGAKRPTMKEVEYKVQNLRRIRLKKTGHCLVKVDEETEHPPRDSPYAFSEVVDQANQYTSRNYTLEKEFMWSHHCPR